MAHRQSERAQPRKTGRELADAILSRARGAAPTEDPVSAKLMLSNPLLTFAISAAPSLALSVGMGSQDVPSVDQRLIPFRFPPIDRRILAAERVSPAIGTLIQPIAPTTSTFWTRLLNKLGYQGRSETSLCTMVFVPVGRDAQPCQLSFVMRNELDFPTHLRSTFSSPEQTQSAVLSLLRESSPQDPVAVGVAEVLSREVFLPTARRLAMLPNAAHWSDLAGKNQLSILAEFSCFDLSAPYGTERLLQHVRSEHSRPGVQSARAA